MRYVDGYVVPVPKKNTAAYRRMAQKAGKVWREHGALEYIECIADDVKPGKWTSFPQSVRLKRDETLRSIRQQGRQAWKQTSGYHRRSLVETLMFRLKTIFGDKLSARGLETQTTQALIRCRALNPMTHLGMPQSYLAR